MNADISMSVTRWLDYFQHLAININKNFEWHTKFAKVGRKFSLIGNKPWKIAKDFKYLAKSAHTDLYAQSVFKRDFFLS